MPVITVKKNPISIVFAVIFFGYLVLVSGCNLTPINVEDSYRFRPPQGTVIDLRTSLSVSPGSNQAYIQAGESKSARSELDSYLPWCEFRVVRSSKDMQSGLVIEKARFTVSSSHRAIDYSAIERSMQPSIMLAGRERILWPAHPEASMENMATIMRLDSKQQPQVKAIVCMIFSDALSVNHLTLREIRATLGEIATINLPDPIGE